MAQRAVFRSAEDLYTQLPVRDVVRVLAKTKQDAEKKREELRDLVGHRYHDLIDSADAIISMNDTVAEFEKNLFTIEKSANLLLSVSKSSSAPTLTSSLPPPVTTAPPSHNQVDVHIQYLLKAPTQIWAALDASQELLACRIWLRATQYVDELNILSRSFSFPELGKSKDVYGYLVECAEADAEQFGQKHWQVEFPLLLSQSQVVLLECRRDIVDMCHAAFTELTLSPTRVEKAMEALMLLKEVNNPVLTLLEARSKQFRDISDSSLPEDKLLQMGEIISKTTVDGEWLLQKFRPRDLDNTACTTTWVNDTIAPLVQEQAGFCLSRVSTIAGLDILHKQVAQVINNQELFQSLFSSVFSRRKRFLLMQSRESTLSRVKRILSPREGKKKRQSPPHILAMKILMDNFSNEEDDDDAWIADLVDFLEKTTLTTWLGRFCALLMSKRKISDPSLHSRLTVLQQASQALFVIQVMDIHVAAFEAQAGLLPWQRGQHLSSTMGGWSKDEVHGNLPAFPSFPCASLCFHTSCALDEYFGEEDDEMKDEGLIRVLGEAVWKRMHTVYSSLAKASSGSDGKLQAGFDLEYASMALLGLERTLLPFTNGGVDVYACASVLKQRARASAGASHWLFQEFTKQSLSSGKPGCEDTALLLTLVEPVPRFALLPVPQRSRVPLSPHKGSDMHQEPTTKVMSAAPTTTTATTSSNSVFGLFSSPWG